MKKTLIATLMFGGLFAAALPAQTAAPADEKEPKVAARKERQQQRIANGVKSGELRAGETARLENKESRINKETRTDRAANGGRLTVAEKKQLNHQQNKVSKDIYGDKHNAAEQQK
jgi:hypothetical protein